MAFTSARTRTRFLSGEHAPAPQEAAISDIQIPNHLGNLVLNVPQIDVAERSGRILLDTSVEPPVLRFDEAPVEVLFGQPDVDGNFIQFEHELRSGLYQVSGDYSGPGSELAVS